MDYLARGDAPISEELWDRIDSAVVESAKQHMVCRRFLPIFGPLGAGTSHVAVDRTTKEEVFDNNVGRIAGRSLVELPLLYQDFTLLWRDIAEAEKNGHPVDLSVAATAAQMSARQEDELFLFGNAALGTEGLFTAAGAHTLKRGDWSAGENAYADVAQAVAYFLSNSMLGHYALVVSPDVYMQLQRLQPNVGLLEIDRIKTLISGRVYAVGAFGLGKAALVCADSRYMDIAIGMDLSVGYLGQSDLNHPFRIMETVALRIKEPGAIVIFE